jgi:hypothetical protein
MSRAPSSTGISLGQRIAATRTAVKSFVLYQLCNQQGATGSGVGCGFFDVDGHGDEAGIATDMNAYIFTICFGEDAGDHRLLYFLDFTLGHLTNGFFVSGDFRGFVATPEGILSGLRADSMRQFWRKHGEAAKEIARANPDRTVVTDSYIAKYADDLPEIFSTLDSL